MLAKLTLSAVVLAMTTAAASALTFDFRNPAVPGDGINVINDTDPLCTKIVGDVTVTATAGFLSA